MRWRTRACACVYVSVCRAYIRRRFASIYQLYSQTFRTARIVRTASTATQPHSHTATQPHSDNSHTAKTARQPEKQTAKAARQPERHQRPFLPATLPVRTQGRRSQRPLPAHSASRPAFANPTSFARGGGRGPAPGARRAVPDHLAACRPFPRRELCWIWRGSRSLVFLPSPTPQDARAGCGRGAEGPLREFGGGSRSGRACGGGVFRIVRPPLLPGAQPRQVPVRGPGLTD